jgi:hypothetical protein
VVDTGTGASVGKVVRRRYSVVAEWYLIEA